MHTLSHSAVPSPVLRVIQVLQRAGYQAVIVGGAVRDLVLQRPTNDWDVASSATPEDFLALFPRCHPTGLKHGTVTVVEGDLPVELTTFRGDGAYSDGRRPDEVRFGVPLVEDLARRDFTINAMAWDPLQDQLHDPFGGLSDLAQRIVRAVGDPRARFSEDGLRPMRAIRIATALSFSVEPATLAAIPETLPTFRKVAVERIREELLKTVGAPRPSSGLELLRETGLLAEFLPEASVRAGAEHSRFQSMEAWRRALRRVDAVPSGEGARLFRLAALLLEIARPVPIEGAPVLRAAPVGAPIAEEIGRRWRLSAEEVATLSSLVARYPLRYDPDAGDAALRFLLRRAGLELLPGLVALWRADVLSRDEEGQASALAAVAAFEAHVARVLAENPPLAMKDLALTGDDLMRAGVPRGPRVGEVLRYFLDRVTEAPSLNTKEGLLALLPEALARPGSHPSR